ncbi:MAG: 50S ribosomal protein L40e [Candidatus Pacearchaeota archaeon]
MAKIIAAQNRLFKNIFVCRVCKAKIRAPPSKVMEGKVKCRKCKSSSLRPIRRKERK